MMLNDRLRQQFQGPFDEERVWMDRFEGHTFDRDVDEMVDVLTEHAEDLEDTFGCVSLVESYERGTQLGPAVVLVLVVPRTANKDLFEMAMGPVSHRIMDDLVDYGE
jgi:hypothetical protein